MRVPKAQTSLDFFTGLTHRRHANKQGHSTINTAQVNQNNNELVDFDAWFNVDQPTRGQGHAKARGGKPPKERKEGKARR